MRPDGVVEVRVAPMHRFQDGDRRVGQAFLPVCCPDAPHARKQCDQLIDCRNNSRRGEIDHLEGEQRDSAGHQAGARLTCEKDRDGVLLVLDVERSLPAALENVVEERLTGAL